MKQEKPLLETFKEVFDNLEENGIVTREQIEKGFNVPISWLASTGLQRNVIIGALRNLYERKYPTNRYVLNRFKRNVNINYTERNGKPCLEVLAGKNTIFITDEEMESKGYERNVLSKDFATEIPKYKEKYLILQEMYQNDKTKEQATDIVKSFYNNYQQQIDIYATPHFLNEMAINFGEYYQWLQAEKQLIEAENTTQEVEGPIETRGGLVELRKDVVGSKGIKGDNSHKERKSDIYPFERRDAIFRGLKPIRRISFDTIDEDGTLIKGAYTCYVYRHSQDNQNKGYFMISEPDSGDKETRTVYLTDKEIEDGKDANEYWNSLAREHIEMTRKEFLQKDGSYIFRHRGDLETYKQKMQALINGPSAQNPQSQNAIRARYALINSKILKEITGNVTERGLREARVAIPSISRAQGIQTKEGEVRDEQ